MATVRSRGNGVWEVRWYQRGPDGTTKQRSKRIKAASEREAKLAAAVHESRERERAVEYRVRDALHELIAHGGRRSVRSNSEVERRARLHILPRIGDLALSELTPRRLEELYAALQLAGKSAGLVRHVHSDMHQALFLAKRDGWIDRNVAEDVILPRLSRRRIEPPSLLELRQIIDAADARSSMGWGSVELALLLRLAAVTGGRLGEVMALRYQDLEGHVARINRSVEEHGSALRIKPTKTDNHRMVPIPVEMAAYIAAHRAAVEAYFGHAPAPGDLIFVSTDRPFDQPPRPSTMNSRYVRLMRTMPFKVRLHDFRHFAASSWLKLLPAIEASKLAGHSKTSTTTDIYGHLLEATDDGTVSSILAPVLRRGAG